MKGLLITILTLGSLTVCAEANLPKCDIQTLKDAQDCMDKVASEHVEYNLPNIGSASIQKDLLSKVLKATARDNSKAMKHVSEADFVGVMLEKGDEWYLYYYALKIGKARPVIEIESINLVDLNDELVSSLTVKELILGDKNKKFDRDDRNGIKDYLDLE